MKLFHSLHTTPPIPKLLSRAVCGLMVLAGLSMPAYASDIEIYQSSKNGKVTVMLLLDISGSMNLPNSVFDDYYLRSGNNPFSGANGRSTIDTPILDAIANANTDSDLYKQRIVKNSSGNGECQVEGCTGYLKQYLDKIPDDKLAGYARADAEAELAKYRAFSPYSYCQDSSVASYRPTGWQPTLITETAPGGYTRQYCRVPKDYNVVGSPNYIAKEYWRNNDIRLNTSVADLTIGCDDMGTEYRCYSRISRLKNALYDIINGNKAKGIEPLDDKFYLGIATLGIRTKYTPNAPWAPDAPLNSAMDMRNRDLGAIRVPARALGATVNGKTQREILNDFIKDDDIFDAHTGTPTARSYAETVSYMMGTSTLPPTSKMTIQERDIFNGSTYAHRVCIEWNGTQCIRTQMAGVTAINTHTSGKLENVQFYNTNGDQSWIYGLPVNTNPNGVLDRKQDWLNAANGGISRNTDLLLNVGSNAYLMFGYPREYVTGFPYSAVESKTTDGTKYQQPDSLINQTHPQCSGQGIYVLSDGRPAFLPYEEAQMQRALGDKGASFQCSKREVLGDTGSVTNDWECVQDLAKTIKDPSKNPANLSFKTAVVGFARQYIDGSIPAYDPKLSSDENIAKVTGVQDQHNFARWGMQGEGGWYAGTSSQSVVDSINAFVGMLIKDIPPVATGQPFIPIDPLNRFAFTNDAYYGSFTPDVSNAKSFWAGDMNRYTLTNQLLYGQGNKPLFDGNGMIDTTVLGLWDKGASSKLPLRNANRPVFTNTSTGMTRVTADNVFTDANIAGAGNVYRNAWLNILGYKADVNGTPLEKSAIGGTPELRQLGALLHSTPIILTQEAKVSTSGGTLNITDRKDYILYGSTQGILHIVDTATGVEKVAFVPNEMMTRHKDNFQDNVTALGNMTYGVDGQWTAYTQYVSAGTSSTVNGGGSPASSQASDLLGKGVQWAYGGLRMGGRSYYGLDLSDLDNPKMLFHINPDAHTTGALSYMGQSWSKPTLGFVNWQGQRRLVMFVGGGYDTRYEQRNYASAGDDQGAGVYMFDAYSGDLLWWVSKHADNTTGTKVDNLQYSVVSNIATFDRNNDGLVDNLFFGDLGGQVFRVDFDNAYDHTKTTPATDDDSLITRVQRLYNGHQAGGLSPRFYETPSFSVHSGIGADGQFGAVSIASGNRSSPLATDGESAKDALFVIYDHNTLQPDNAKNATAQKATDATDAELVELTASDMATKGITKDKPFEKTLAKKADGTLTKGWKYYLSPNKAGNLKGFSSPRVVDNVLFLNTYTPNATTQANDCSAGVLGKSYQELFCMPSGVCTEEQRKVVTISDANTTEGSITRAEVAPGIVNTPSGGQTVDPSSKGFISGSIFRTLDCSGKDKANPVCIQELSRISNKPVRWYEDTPRTQ